MNFDLPKNVRFILDRFNGAGYSAYVVGGPTRDMLRGVTPYDYDVTTNARPDEIKALFADLRTVDTGIKHGTVTIVIDGEPYEVTTYRIDGEYLDSRHPADVEFTDKLELDLLRRDFTMNAIAYNPRVGLVDSTGGVADIKDGIIRCVGEPSLRFSEDALRILRALRFSATLGFEIEEATADAILALKANLDFVSRERVFQELKKMLSGAYLAPVLLSFMSVLSLVVPEWDGIEDLTNVDFSTDFLVNLIALFALSKSGAEVFAERMRELRSDGATVKAGLTVLSAFGKYDISTRDGLIALAIDLGADYARLYIRVAVALSPTDKDAIDILEQILDKVPTSLRDLKISGKDLTYLGFVGEEIGKTLSELLRLAAFSDLENEKDCLISVAKKLKG